MKENLNNPSFYEGKKIRISISNNNIYYTIAKVLSLTDTHLLFKDKYGEVKGIRITDIAEIMEVK